MVSSQFPLLPTRRQTQDGLVAIDVTSGGKWQRLSAKASNKCPEVNWKQGLDSCLPIGRMDSLRALLENAAKASSAHSSFFCAFSASLLPVHLRVTLTSFGPS